MANKEELKRYAVSVVGYDGNEYMNRLTITVAVSKHEAKGFALESFAKACPDCPVGANIAIIEVPTSQSDNELIKVLRRARQAISIASDWNLPELEIDGRMTPTYDLIREIDEVLGKEPNNGE